MKNKLNELKKLVKSKYFSPALVLIILIIVAIFLYQMGFRITYAPELETSWDAVSAVASWAGAAGTVAAVWFAIRVADKQNKIALFEKRYEIYKQYVKYYALAIQVGVAQNREEIQRAWLDIDRSIWNESMIDNTKKIFSKTEEARFKMSQARYLFNEEIGSNVDDFMTLLIEVVYLSLFDNKKSEMKKYQEKLIEYTDKKESMLLLMEMEGYLHLERLGDKHALHRS